MPDQVRHDDFETFYEFIKVTETIEFYDGGKFGYGGHDMIKRGIEFARRGLRDKAKTIWQECSMPSVLKNSYALYMNLFT